MAASIVDIAFMSPIHTDILHDAVKVIYIWLPLGLLFQITIIKVEFELYMQRFLAAYAIAYVWLFIGCLRSAESSIFGAYLHATFAFSCFNTGFLIGVIFYRLFFHRCRKFPGPLAAKLTRFYAAKLNAKEYKYYRELDNLHKEYGIFVRTGPREISVLEKDAIPLIYGPQSKCTKSSWYGQTGNDNSKVSIAMTRDTKQYRLRRRAWDRGLSSKALALYEPRIKSKADILVDQLHATSGRPIDATKWSMLFAFDVMGEVGFGKHFNGLASGQEHPGIKAIHDHLAALGVLQTLPWLLNLLKSLPGASKRLSDFSSVCEKEIMDKEKAWDSKKEPQDIISWLLKAFQDKDVSAPPTRKSLSDDSRVVIMAGSDTTANTLANILFYFAKYPTVQQKLHGMVDSSLLGDCATLDYEKVKTITYIDDIINETLRLKPPVVQGHPRETPTEGIQVRNAYVPGNVNVIVPYTLIQRDPRWWQRPNEFMPERWGEKRIEMRTDDAPFLAFSLGLHSCAGRNLAFLSLRTALAAIVRNFEISFAPGESGEAFDKQFLDTFLMTLPPVQLEFRPRH